MHDLSQLKAKTKTDRKFVSETKHFKIIMITSKKESDVMATSFKFIFEFKVF